MQTRQNTDGEMRRRGTGERQSRIRVPAFGEKLSGKEAVLRKQNHPLHENVPVERNRRLRLEERLVSRRRVHRQPGQVRLVQNHRVHQHQLYQKQDQRSYE